MKRLFQTRPGLGLCLLLFLLYAMTYHGFTGAVVDETMMLATTSQMVEAHTLQINPMYPALLIWGAPQSDPATPIYSKYPIGQSILALPLYLAGKLIPVNLQAKGPNDLPFIPAVPLLFMMALGAFTTVGTAWGVFQVAKLLGASERTAALVFILFGIATFAWPYAKRFYNEPSTALAFIWMTYFAIRARRYDRPRDGLLAGACFCAAVLFRATSAALAPFLLLYCVPDYFWRNWKRTFRSILLPALGVIAAVLLTFLYNAIRFGSISETGYEAGFGRVPWEALIGYLVSPSRSLLLFAPPLLLVLPGALLLFRRGFWREVLLLVSCALMPALIYATWWAWDGGGSLGPRFLIPSVPLLIVLLVPLFGLRARLWRWGLAGVAVAGYTIQILFNLVTPGDIDFELFEVRHLSPNTVNWEFSQSLIANAWSVYQKRAIDPILFRVLPLKNPVLLALFFLLICSTVVIGMLRLARRLPALAPAETSVNPSKTLIGQERNRK